MVKEVLDKGGQANLRLHAAESPTPTLTAKLSEQKMTKRHGQRIWVDTTVAEANIHHPSDAVLLADRMPVLTHLMRRAKEPGIGVHPSVCSRVRSVRRGLSRIGQLLRRGRDRAQAVVERLTAEMARRAEQTLHEAERMAQALRRRTRRLGLAVGPRYWALTHHLLTYTQRPRRVLEQTQLWLRGMRIITDRLASLFDPDARAIRRRKLSKPVEFSYKLAVVKIWEGFISHFRLYLGPPDDSLLTDAATGHVCMLGAKRRAVATDPGMRTQQHEAALSAMGIAHVAPPPQRDHSRARRLIERRRAFRRRVRWCSDQKSRIAHLKRAFELDRSRYRAIERAFSCDPYSRVPCPAARTTTFTDGFPYCEFPGFATSLGA